MRAGRNDRDRAGRRHADLMHRHAEVERLLLDLLADAAPRRDPMHGHVRRVIVGNKEVLLGAVEREMQGAIGEANRRLKRLEHSGREDRKGLNEMVRTLDLRHRARNRWSRRRAWCARGSASRTE